MTNYLVYLRFIGARYSGSQIQANAPSVQGEFQRALAQTLGELPDIKCCSRTDSGVHANRFCISFKSEKSIKPDKLAFALNARLPDDIRVMDAAVVPDDFHARYSCVHKRYIYKVYNNAVEDPFVKGRALWFRPEIDEKLLDDAAKAFVGTHDFSAFSSVKRKSGEAVRTVYDFTVTRRDKLVTFSVTADGFLYNMVRIMVGTLLNVARGKLEKKDISDILISGKRVNLCATAPAEGLYLDDVSYEGI